MIKVLLNIFIIFFMMDLAAQNGWTKIQSPLTTNLTKVVFKDSLVGWASGDSGKIIHTSNGGISWDFQNSGIKNNIQTLFFLDKLKGWGVSWFSTDSIFGTHILKTTNGGINWDYNSSTFFDKTNVLIFPVKASTFIP